MESAELHARLSTTQRVRDLWVLREQARVRAVEFRFLRQLENILNQHILRVYDKQDMNLNKEEETQNGKDSFVSISNTGPTRERNYRHSLVSEVQMIQQSRLVTGLSEEYRSILEGNIVSPSRQSWFGGDLWRQVIEQQTVSNALSSSFRHQLEFALLHSQSIHSSSTLRPFIVRDSHSSPRRRHQETTNWEDFSDIQDSTDEIELSETNYKDFLLDQMNKLQTDIQWIKSTMQASFDLQLEIQREVRQEIAAVLHDCNSKTVETSLAFHSQSISKGTCIVCAQNVIDSLLYSCGHMCTCCYCGRQLIATGQVGLLSERIGMYSLMFYL
ncbi:protein binding protein / zinc ion binding protein [Galdieria sulphuraria]|uniref:Protein binding protein / zinc ion binding protein n=1 Tax=Galdieria sulphuraria TaxID=130081 RepID=M2W0F8_GALSU|nr:protein binding protein / zinc ion binding protein [Galdieria sulphuraria]EME29096.1 protein binding protein / zinc ion binding protein [Galdieria sulphuraria]|eukprot:XP_005705616.1 protein binding protein / zinc ion binding protein [Galdieria sulphuraria]